MEPKESFYETGSDKVAVWPTRGFRRIQSVRWGTSEPDYPPFLARAPRGEIILRGPILHSSCSKPEKFYYLEGQRDGVKSFLQCLALSLPSVVHFASLRVWSGLSP